MVLYSDTDVTAKVNDSKVSDRIKTTRWVRQRCGLSVR